MNSAAILVVGLVGVVVAAWGLALWLRGRSEAQASALRQEIQAQLSSQLQLMTTQIGQLTQVLTQQFGQVTGAVQSGLAHSGQLVSQAQSALSNELARIAKQLGELQKAEQDLSQASQTLQVILGGAKSRGTLGEIGLERLLEDALPQGAYRTQYRFSSGNVVDAIVKAGDKILSIDSKFPLDDYRRLVENGEEARKDFAQGVRKHADSIAEKYILPNETTLDVALMFVPSESVYYELLMTEDSKGRVDAYCRAKGVVPVSPNTLYAYLSVVLIGLRGMQVQENAQRLLGSLGGLHRQLEIFAETFEKLGTHVRNAQQSYEDSRIKLSRTRAALEQMAQGALPEAAPKALESAAKE
jgi:DNA recombination protein RmuC